MIPNGVPGQLQILLHINITICILSKNIPNTYDPPLLN